jgi:hypothetical protein
MQKIEIRNGFMAFLLLHCFDAEAQAGELGYQQMSAPAIRALYPSWR